MVGEAREDVVGVETVLVAGEEEVEV